MRFELTVALKYLIPKWRQLSVSIISLISVLVISLVVWLIVLFLSVTEGIEQKWIEELVTLNAHVRMSPSEAYYRSYFYQIDTASLDSNYTTKTLGEKLGAPRSDPYDPGIDIELSLDFPAPDRHEDGRLKDPVKEGFEAIHSLGYAGLRTQEYEVSFGNLRLHMLRDESALGESEHTFLTQVSYIASHDSSNARTNRMVVSPSSDDYNNLLKAIIQTGTSDSRVEDLDESLGENLKRFFQNLEIKELKTTSDGFVLPPSLFPQKGNLKGVGILRYGKIVKAVIPKTLEQLPLLEQRLTTFGFKTTPVDLLFTEGQPYFLIDNAPVVMQGVKIVLDENIPFKAHLVDASLERADTLSSLVFQVEGHVQQLQLLGETPYEHLEIASAQTHQKKEGESEPFWIYPAKEGGCKIPEQYTFNPLGEGLLISKYFQANGVRLGDRGYLAYYAQAGSSMQEQRVPVYVAGFYDPGMVPVGNKLIFANSHVIAMLRGSTIVADPMLGNGINIWLGSIKEAEKFKEELLNALELRGIKKYWTVQSFHDYEFTKPILEQLQSDKSLFTLVAIIILVVACSNIISMLILLVNDKRKEIGILQSMGASPRRIAVIFGLCGFVTGAVSCLIGTAAAILTLKNLQSLVDLLSFLQGREAFQTAFYGSTLPNTLSYSVLSLVLIATLLISLLAGIIPAVKASKIRPTEILKSE